MTYIPREAVRDLRQVRGEAFNLYVFYCEIRDEATGESEASHARIHEETGISFTYITDLRQKLRDEGWIEVLGKRRVRPLKGFVTSEYPDATASDFQNNGEPSDNSNSAEERASEDQNGTSLRSDKQNFGLSERSDNPNVASRTTSDYPNGRKSRSDNPNRPPRPPYKEGELRIELHAAAGMQPAARESPEVRHLDRAVDDDFLCACEAMPAYEGVNVRGVYRQALARCAADSKDPTKPDPLTRRRLMRWLNEALLRRNQGLAKGGNDAGSGKGGGKVVGAARIESGKYDDVSE